MQHAEKIVTEISTYTNVCMVKKAYLFGKTTGLQWQSDEFPARSECVKCLRACFVSDEEMKQL
jgi:hypothetical protein